MDYQSKSSTSPISQAVHLISGSTLKSDKLYKARSLPFSVKEKSDTVSQKSHYDLSSATNKRSDHTISPNIDRYCKYIINLIKSDEYIEGEISKTGLYLENLHAKDEYIFRMCFQKVWLELFKLKNPLLLSTFIGISSTLEYSWLEDTADTLILGAYSHTNTYVIDAVLRAVESWENPGHLAYLEQMRPLEIDWLEEYRQSILKFLSEL